MNMAPGSWEPGWGCFSFRNVGLLSLLHRIPSGMQGCRAGLNWNSVFWTKSRHTAGPWRKKANISQGPSEPPRARVHSRSVGGALGQTPLSRPPAPRHNALITPPQERDSLASVISFLHQESALPPTWLAFLAPTLSPPMTTFPPAWEPRTGASPRYQLFLPHKPIPVHSQTSPTATVFLLFLKCVMQHWKYVRNEDYEINTQGQSSSLKREISLKLLKTSECLVLHCQTQRWWFLCVYHSHAWIHPIPWDICILKIYRMLFCIFFK